MNTSKLPVADKLVRGQDIITMSTNNPDVPGNAAALAAFVTAQAELQATNAAYEAARTACAEASSARADKIAAWTVSLTGLAGVTENITMGDRTKILSTGFDVKAQPAPPQPVGQVENVRVAFTGNPGYSEVRWKRVTGADAYIVECSADPITETSWRNMGTVAEVKYVGNGATPGQKCWYRIAAVNRAGRGPWSDPALRPVM
ncbi:MAG: fibronectin type III domain-containing protein [Chthoniobacteraceae bacterium]